MLIFAPRVLNLLPPLAAALLLTGITAQCQLDWQPGTPIAGPSGRVTTLANLPNGDLIAGGWFDEAGAALARHIARWDGAQWHALGAGIDDNVYDLEVLPNGNLIAAGKFESAGGQAAAHIARWDGAAWSPLGPGLDGIVNCIDVLPNGNLVAGGLFEASGSTSMALVAQWDGTSWSQLGAGVDGGEVRSMAVLANGDLIIGGLVTEAAGVPVNGIARWDGASWSALPFQPIIVESVAAAPNGELAVSGLLDVASFATVWTWDGNTVTPLGNLQTFQSGGVLYYDTNGDLLRLGNLFGGELRPVQRWDGTAWTQLGNIADVAGITLHRDANGALLLAGGPNTSLTPYRPTLATLNGSTWETWGGPVLLWGGFARGPTGDLLVSFAAPLGDPPLRRWNGSQWTPVATGITGSISSMMTLADGTLLLTGLLTIAGNEEFAALWDGAVVTPISDGLAQQGLCLAQDASGTMYVGTTGTSGGTGVLFFDGTMWQPLGVGMDGVVYDLDFLPNGDLIACFNRPTLSQYECRRWDGATWSLFGPALQGRILSAQVQPDGTVLLGGRQLLSTAGSFMVEGNGGAWTQAGSFTGAYVSGLQAMPNGDVLAYGDFETVAGLAANGIARLADGTWQNLGSGSNAFVTAAGWTRSGQLFVSGPFTRFDGVPSAAIARADTSCPADVQSYGTGCLGPAGPLYLAAESFPWIGSSYRARVYGMPAVSVAVHVVGFAQASVPLAPVLPQSSSNCSLLVTADIVNLVVPDSGVTETNLTIPAVPALVGATFHEQALMFQLGAGQQIVSVASSNGQSATIGSF